MPLAAHLLGSVVKPNLHQCGSMNAPQKGTLQRIRLCEALETPEDGRMVDDDASNVIWHRVYHLACEIGS